MWPKKGCVSTPWLKWCLIINELQNTPWPRPAGGGGERKKGDLSMEGARGNHCPKSSVNSFHSLPRQCSCFSALADAATYASRHAPIIVSEDTCLVFLTEDPGAMN